MAVVARGRREVERFTERAPLLAAVRAWCERELESRRWMRPIVADLPHIVWTQTGDDAHARDVYVRTQKTLEEAAALPRGSYYAEELRRLVAAVRDAGVTLSGVFPEEAERIQIVKHVLMVRPKSTIREIAIVSLLAGNGRDWATTQIKKARDTLVRTHQPTVLDAVRAEERAVRQARSRITK